MAIITNGFVIERAVKRSERAPGAVGRFYPYEFCEVRDVSSLVRGYVHKSWRNSERPELTDIKEASDYFLSCLDDNIFSEFFPTQYFIGILWKDDLARVVDIFRYGGPNVREFGVTSWRDNPEVSSLVFRNGVYVPNPESDTCEDGLILLGEEGRHRRSTSSLKEYAEKPPKIKGITFA